MQIFGLVSLLVTVAIAAWWLVSSGPVSTTTSEDGSVQESTYQEAIESAQDAVGAVEVKNDPPASGPQIEVYAGVSVPQNTKVLDLSGRGLTGSLKAEIRHLQDLQVLDISDNNFTGLPAEVGQLSKLQTLDLSNNPFTGLPYELGNLKNLKTFDLRGTNYAEQDLDVIRKNLPSSTVIMVGR